MAELQRSRDREFMQDKDRANPVVGQITRQVVRIVEIAMTPEERRDARSVIHKAMVGQSITGKRFPFVISVVRQDTTAVSARSLQVWYVGSATRKDIELDIAGLMIAVNVLGFMDL